MKQGLSWLQWDVEKQTLRPSEPMFPSSAVSNYPNFTSKASDSAALKEIWIVSHDLGNPSCSADFENNFQRVISKRPVSSALFYLLDWSFEVSNFLQNFASGHSIYLDAEM